MERPSDLVLVSRSDNPSALTLDFARLGGGPVEIWKRFLELAPAGFAEFWVAYRGGEAVGRIGANPLPSHPGSGAIGSFAAADEIVAHALLAVAEEWLRARGFTRAVGPMTLNTWFPYRFRVDDHPLKFVWEPNNPASYPAYFQSAGYRTLEEYHTPAAQGLAGYVDATRSHYERAVAAGFTFRGFDVPNFLEREVPILHAMGHSGFQENFLFEPIALPIFRELYVPIANKLDLTHSFIAMDGAREAAVFFIFPDGDYLIFKTITVLPEYRGMGLSTALSYLGAKRAAAAGMDRFATALIRNGNHSESYTAKGTSLWSHRYVLYAKGLD